MVVNITRSDSLSDAALHLLETKQTSQRGTAKRVRAEAADLFTESARLRPFGDISAYVALHRVGSIHARDGRSREAERAFVQSAIRALEACQVYEAALAFTHASEVARSDRGADDRLIDYTRRALRMTESMRMTDDQRRDIRRRLEGRDE